MLLLLGGAYWLLRESGYLFVLSNRADLQQFILELGVWGPLIVIALMVLAIVMSPIPSGPIALAAGAAYGPVWGTVWIVLGAEAGALIAFGIARWLGYEAVERKLDGRLSFLKKERSQAALMGVVFASRLVPFLSFDAVSYAAGLSPLSFLRFALATLAGVVPISFALAYFGEHLIEAESDRLLLVAVLVGGITLLPVAFKLLRDWRRQNH